LETVSSLFIIGIAFQIWMVIDCIKRKESFFWIAVILLFGPLGALVYLVGVKLAGVKIKAKLNFNSKGRAQNGEVDRLEELVKLHGKAFHHKELGLKYLYLGDLGKAELHLSQSVEKDEELLDAHYGLSKALYGQGKYLESAHVLEVLTAKDKKFDYGNALLGLAESYRMAGMEDKAMEAYEAVVASYSFFKAYHEYAMLLKKAGRLEEALRMMENINANAEALPEYKYQKEKIWIDSAQKFIKRYGTQ
jgi:hypothetical protein